MTVESHAQVIKKTNKQHFGFSEPVNYWYYGLIVHFVCQPISPGFNDRGIKLNILHGAPLCRKSSHNSESTKPKAQQHAQLGWFVDAYSSCKRMA